MKKARSKKKIVLIVLSCILVLLVGGWWAMCAMIYEGNINTRLSTYEPYRLYVEDFEGLQRTKYEFPSDKGQMLTGYLYSAGKEPRGIIVIVHGYGAGHNAYMDCANAFAQHGYDVFAYDATGNDESEGNGVGGFPQGVIDLDHALSFIEDSGNFPKLPIGLFGHSWGGYSACSVLTYHPEIKAVIECAGSNGSSDLFEAGGKQQADDGIYAIMPFVKLHERIKFGKYATNTALDGFAASEAAVMAVHSADDDVVPIGYGFDLYYEKNKDDPRFVFLRLEDRGHSYLYDDMTYIDAFNAEFDEWLKTLDYDLSAAENKEKFAADKAEYISEHLDRQKWCDKLDEEMFARFSRFYDEHMQA